MIGDAVLLGTRLLLIGVQGSELRAAAAMAREAGADVVLVDRVTDALIVMRETGSDLAMVEVGADVAGFIASLRRERMAIPVFACGIDASAALAVAAIRAGAQDYLPLPPDRDLIAAAILSVTGIDRALIGVDPAFSRAVDLGLKLASSQVPILISGEAGCGKQLLARAIHRASGCSGPFVVVDCADIGPGDIESELFGHAQGAFHGAVARRRGRIVEAEAGTLFIRQISALPLPIQSKLAPLLGGDLHARATSASGARIIASTTVDLAACAEAGLFRTNLLAGLALVQIALPPLCERPGDIAALARHFAQRYANLDGLSAPTLGAAAIGLLESQPWTDNIRGLDEVMHRAVLLSGGGEIGITELVQADGSALMGFATPRSPASTPLRGLVGSTVEDVERSLILETLRHCRGNRTSASSILGISVRTMRNKLKAFVEHGAAVEARA